MPTTLHVRAEHRLQPPLAAGERHSKLRAFRDALIGIRKILRVDVHTCRASVQCFLGDPQPVLDALAGVDDVLRIDLPRARAMRCASSIADAICFLCSRSMMMPLYFFMV